MSKEPILTQEQLKELENLSIEIEKEAIELRKDYEDNPSEESGSVIVVHQDSEYLTNEETDDD
jgi:hypothetical protein|tara:strand:+ start:2741 stop:2929 length:189 start_codon:yes stop_codon:yes gene_type:complete